MHSEEDGSRYHMYWVMGNSKPSEIEADGIILNITGRDKHVPEIERYISTVK